MNPESLEQLYIEQGVNTESECLLIYMNDKLEINSEVRIFEIEETEDDLSFEKEGIHYVQLFPIYMAQEMIEDFFKAYSTESNLDIAKRLLDYRINDA